MTFSDFVTHPALVAALVERGFERPTQVQIDVLAPACRGRDLLVSSRTGSGKTVAFGLLIADALLTAGEAFLKPKAPGALVIAPTRELAAQVSRELGWLFSQAGGRVTTCIGGMDPRREARALSSGANVVVGTPGRLCDHLERGALDLSELSLVVFDEADEMLDMGFREEMESILERTPAKKRTVLFSATLPKPILELARRYTREPVRIAATPPEEGHSDIEYRAHIVAEREREHAVVNVLRFLEPPTAIVFRNTREAVQHTSAGLSERGFSVVAISGELAMPERTRAITAVRDGRARVLVATDVAARGLDLPSLGLVLHADVPRDAQGLLHRSGRTGRAGRKGLAVLLATPRERHRLEVMLRSSRTAAIFSPVPGPHEIRVKDAERLLLEVDALSSEPSKEELSAARRLLDGHDPLSLALALVRRERSRMPAPEELPASMAALAETPAPAHGPRRATPQDTVWFRLVLRRDRKADPKWVLPLLCRRGEVTRAEIGRIQVLPGETRFEVTRAASEPFARAAARPDPRMPDAHIERLATVPDLGQRGPARPGRRPR